MKDKTTNKKLSEEDFKKYTELHNLIETRANLWIPGGANFSVEENHVGVFSYNARESLQIPFNFFIEGNTRDRVHKLKKILLKEIERQEKETREKLAQLEKERIKKEELELFKRLKKKFEG